MQKIHQIRLRGLGFLDSYGSSRDLADIGEAISSFKEAVSLTPDTHELLPKLLNGVGVSLRFRFEATGNLEDISESISVLQRAVDLTPEDSGDLPFWLYDLGTSLMLRFAHTGELSDISVAIATQQRAIELSPNNSPSLALRLNSLGISLTRRFEHTGDIADLSEAISAHQKAVRLSLSGDSESLAYRLNSLGNALMRRFQYTGNLLDISSSISLQRNAIGHTPRTQASLMCPRLDNLGIALMLRFVRTGDLDDISESITAHRQAIELAPVGHPNLPAWLHHLGISLILSFEHTRQLTDLFESISLQQRAIQLTPEGRADLPVWLDSLGSSLMRRFELTGHLTDISEAVFAQKQAVNLTSEGNARLPSRMNNLATSLRGLFQRTKHLSDISEAVALQQRAVLLSPESHVDLPSWLSNLGVSLGDRFSKTGDSADISEAISVQRKAVQLTPNDHAYLPARLTNLGNTLVSRFERSRNIDDISEAISVQDQAVQISPDGHPDLPVTLNNLGRSLQIRFELSKNVSDIESAMSKYRRSATSLSGPLTARLSGARQWAKLSTDFNPSQRLEAWTTVVHLASQVAGLEYTIQERYTFLLDISELSTAAAAVAFDLGRLDLALEWLEQGRCLVWGQLNNLRTPLDALREHDPDLADKLSTVSKALENAGTRTGPLPFSEETPLVQKMFLQSQALAHAKIAQQWQELLAQVRRLPGFEGFLRPLPSPVLMRHLPKSGFLIFINVHPDRCDALALMAGQPAPLHIPLARFSYEKAYNLRYALSTHLHEIGLRMRGTDLQLRNRGMRHERALRSSSVIKEVLHELWNSIVKPILDVLQSFVKQSDSLMPRFWWCATGPLAFLPIHAAGIYDEKESITVSDIAISSYIPSLSVLAERVKSSREIEGSNKGLLMISQPDTPGQRPIPATISEIRMIEQLLSDCGVRKFCLEQKFATVEEGIKQMKAYSCVHLACHAYQDNKEPLRSAFYLQDGPLELSVIIKQNLSHAEFAFLAACQTSTGDEKLSEEAVHLAAGMLAAGYRGVIATMWSISDSVAPKIARQFYSRMLANSKVSPDGKKYLSAEVAAHSLQHATREIRKELGDTDDGLLAWIPFVHFGM